VSLMARVGAELGRHVAVGSGGLGLVRQVADGLAQAGPVGCVVMVREVHFEETISAREGSKLTATSSPSLSTDLLDREAAFRAASSRLTMPSVVIE
jgi:hypothetical protein